MSVHDRVRVRAHPNRHALASASANNVAHLRSERERLHLLAATSVDIKPDGETLSRASLVRRTLNLEFKPNISLQVAMAMAAYRSDPDPKKVNLLLEDFQDEDGKTPPSRVVREAERLVGSKSKDGRYVHADGSGKFATTMTRLVLGAGDASLSTLHVGSVPIASGTYGLILAGRLLTQRGPLVVYLSKPTYWHHRALLSREGSTEFREYRYVNYETKSLDLEGMVADFGAMPPKSVVLLQLCGHNPTGIDPTPSQWREILKVLKTNQLLPIWDNAFHGLASGDFDTDAWAVRHCFDVGIEFLCVQSTAKSFGLDNCNTGNLIIAANTGEQLAAVKSHAAGMAFSIHNSLSCDSAQIVGEILGDSGLQEKWKDEVKSLVDRMKAKRILLRKTLEEQKTPGTWNHITDQVGVYAFLGLDVEQCMYIRKVHHVYVLPLTGRMNVCGINHGNVHKIALAVSEAIKKFGKTRQR